MRTQTTVSGGAVEETVNLLATTLSETPMDVSMMACLALVFLAQVPELPADVLVEGVSKASTWIADYLDTVAPRTAEPEVVH